MTILDHMQFCLVPAGKFVMGSKDEIDLPEFYISRFPITNAQFDEFVSAGGYRNPDYWIQAINVGIWDSGKIKGRYDGKSRNAPHDYGAPFNLSNH
ncbi:MAG TPA: SUMF1/EgtB/PvdO family nonheme iron enzyme, partial [Candidatus Hodarchaeales archaeon]|nr:SUMF1/EgtB/PvdO family nonheme iron enzyme [Candidatus Hodarchaeales archaeon]